MRSASNRNDSMSTINAKVKSKRAFTLMEVLVCMIIIALFFGIGVPYGIKQYRSWLFSKSVERVKQKIELAFALAKVTRCPVDVTFEKRDGKVFISLSPSQGDSLRSGHELKKREVLDIVVDVYGVKETLRASEKWTLPVYAHGISQQNITIVSAVDLAPVPLDLKNFHIECIEDESIVQELFPQDVL